MPPPDCNDGFLPGALATAGIQTRGSAMAKRVAIRLVQDKVWWGVMGDVGGGRGVGWVAPPALGSRFIPTTQSHEEARTTPLEKQPVRRLGENHKPTKTRRVKGEK